jgi:hypothetical protein
MLSRGDGAVTARSRAAGPRRARELIQQLSTDGYTARAPRLSLMASRTVWKGFLQFSLVSVPVKAYTATASGGGRISLNQLRAGRLGARRRERRLPGLPRHAGPRA